MSFNGMNFSHAKDIRIGQNQISALYLKNRKIWPRDPEKAYLIFTSWEENNNFYFRTASSSYTLSIEVSLDEGKTWQTYTSSAGRGTLIGTLDTGEAMCIRGLNTAYSDYETNQYYYHRFISDGRFKASGNIMGLIYGEDADSYGKSFPSNSSYNFAGLFASSKVVDISELSLPATTLTPYCYTGMFSGCKELKVMGSGKPFKATTLAPYCYANMFIGCKNLSVSPILPATTLVEGCYYYMFAGCNKINQIHLRATDISATDCLTSWVANVAPTGTFIKDYALTDIPINSVDGIPVGWIYEELNVPDLSATPLTIQSQSDNNTITYSGSDIDHLFYKTTEESDVYDEFPSAGVTINEGDKLILRGDFDSALQGSFASTGNFKIYGNIQALRLFDTTPVAFRGLFNNCTGLTDARYLLLPYKTLPANGYREMFKGCTSLVTAPKIEARTYGSDACNEMFRGCTSLTTIRPMTVLSIASYGCDHMYTGCRSILIIPEIKLRAAGYMSYDSMFAAGWTANMLLKDSSKLSLPATTAAYAYRYMFQDCTNMTSTFKSLNAPTIASGSWACYSNMFYNCMSLTKAPALPATTLENECYDYMFYNCQSLTEAPALPALTMKDKCYRYMFYNCKSLYDAPELPAPTLQTYCYQDMFNGCTNLNYIKCLATDISATSCTSNWVKNVAASGTFVKDPNMTNWTLDSVNGIPVGWSEPSDWSTSCFTITPIEYPCNLRFGLIGSTTDTGFSYSLDYGSTWNTLNSITHNSSLNIYYMSLTLNSASVMIKSDHWNFAISSNKSYVARGNIMSLIYEDNFVGKTTLKSPGQFRDLFNGLEYTDLIGGTLKKAIDLYLPATTMKSHCYKGMFKNTAITTAPALPATTLAPYCYSEMFANSALNTAPVLNASTLVEGCYYRMFDNSNIIAAPALPATTLAPYCYYRMFADSNVTAVPSLPATTLQPNCYQAMFADSAVAKIIPDSLPATTLVDYCYAGMFSGCTNLTLTNTQYNNLLPATSAESGSHLCYSEMFKGCIGLTKTIKIQLTSIAYTLEICRGMFMNCTGITAFTGNSMTDETYPVMLPATLLGDACYFGMFDGCTGITNSLRAGNTGYVRIFPTQHELTLNTNCFREMFAECKSMIYPAGWDTDINGLAPSSCEDMFWGCKSLTHKTNREAVNPYSVATADMYGNTNLDALSPLIVLSEL